MADDSGPRYKVERVLNEYGVPELRDDLIRGWTGDGTERKSLRTLADEVNRALLRAAMADAEIEPLDGEVENVYRLLTENEVSGSEQIRARRRLERGGIDVDGLEDDFVTYQAVRTYLTEGEGVTHEAPDENHVENAVETIQRLQSRTTAVAEKRIEQLAASDKIVAGNPQLLLNLRVFCDACEQQYDVVEFLEHGGCDCGIESP